jgi:DME family drug/metabolite transporter
MADDETGPSARLRPDAPTAQHAAVGSRAGAAAVAAAAVLWGSMGPIAALYPDGTGLAVAAGRLVVGGLALLIGVTLGRGWTRWRVRDVPLTLAGIATVAGYSALYFPAVQLCGVATATVVSIGGAPAFAGLVSLVRGRRVDRRWAVSSVAAIVGMAMVVLPGAHDAANRLGVILAAAGRGLVRAPGALHRGTRTTAQPR